MEKLQHGGLRGFFQEVGLSVDNYRWPVEEVKSEYDTKKVNLYKKIWWSICFALFFIYALQSPLSSLLGVSRSLVQYDHDLINFIAAYGFVLFSSVIFLVV
jgi:hypothetical protein